MPLIPLHTEFNWKKCLKFLLFGYVLNSIFVIGVAFYLIAETDAYAVIELSFVILGGF